ncbi:LysR substrate-binding domain-containing protein [Ciceribacter ferrooxidans]|uniref:LysR family transcriptional regulator n=1 Tax=Ciceribacter ferrooxidans TaxID=2509717 RepID=A0A4Q2SWH2_9HYPH|nr:LysR substrate-binding domain-containing protein [Ciceribacter ferrooxidans]RYC09933.1 LysR family transcriptional regulator [Ciceribacter ferrooxidans]
MKNLNLVHLNGLRALEAVGRLGSLQRAADELGVSVGAVSQQVIKAEGQLGRQIFERTPKGLVPRKAATDILPRLTEAFSLLSGAVAAARRHDDKLLTISVAPVFAARWLVHRLGGFSARHPEINLRMDATTRLIDPSASDIDLCIRVGKGHWPGVRSELILAQRVFPVCSPALARHLKVPSDLLDLPAVIDGHALFGWDVWLEPAGLGGRMLATRHVFNEASLCLDATIAGQGVMLAWQTLASHAVQTGQLVIPFGPWAPTGDGHYFVTTQTTRRTPAVEAFKTWLREELADDMRALESAFERSIRSRVPITPGQAPAL